jgi:hypothetical protein
MIYQALCCDFRLLTDGGINRAAVRSPRSFLRCFLDIHPCWCRPLHPQDHHFSPDISLLLEQECQTYSSTRQCDFLVKIISHDGPIVTHLLIAFVPLPYQHQCVWPSSLSLITFSCILMILQTIFVWYVCVLSIAETHDHHDCNFNPHP